MKALRGPADIHTDDDGTELELIHTDSRARETARGRCLFSIVKHAALLHYKCYCTNARREKTPDRFNSLFFFSSILHFRQDLYPHQQYSRREVREDARLKEKDPDALSSSPAEGEGHTMTPVLPCSDQLTASAMPRELELLVQDREHHKHR